MKSISKLNLNRNPATTVNGELLYAKNVVATSDQKAVRNEDGFLLHYTADGDVIGKVEVPKGYVLFVNGTTDKIIYYNGVSSTPRIISSNYFNFSKPIKGRYTYDADGNLLVTFTEGIDDTANETRIINLTKYVADTALTADDVKLLDLIPNIIYPTITSDVVSGGRLMSGVYQISVAYETEKGNYSNHSILGEPIYVFGNIANGDRLGNIVNYKINLTLSGLDTRYSNFKLAILYKGEDTFEKTYETGIIPTSQSAYSISNISSLVSVDLLSVLTTDISYIKDQDHTSFAGELFRGNVKTVKYAGFDTALQSVADAVAVGLNIRTVTQFPTTNNIVRHFKEGEQYVLYMGAFDYKGNFVNAYPIKWKAGDATTETPILGSTFRIHTIPYINNANDTVKKVTNLTFTLPNNVSTLLGSFANIVTSFCYFYAEHDMVNSKILAQGFAIRDTHVNDFQDNQTYNYAFRSNTKVRFYALEHLFNKSSLSDISIYNSSILNGFNLAQTGANSVYADLGDTPQVVAGTNNQNHTDRRYSKIIPEFGSILKTKTTATVQSVEYITNDNTVSNNIAGDSFHRITMLAAEVDKIFGSNPAQYPGTEVPANGAVTGLYLWDTDATKLNHYLMAMFDIISNNSLLYDDLYNQKLCICSPIVAKTNLNAIQASGDFFYGNMTIRCTTPSIDYELGANNQDLEGENMVFKMVVSFGIESRANVAARYKGINDYQKVVSISDKNDIATIESLWAIPYRYDNFINTALGKGYDLNCHYNGYDSITYEKLIDTKYHFFNRIIRSNVNSSESNSLGWRKYATDSYKDLPIERGAIMIVESDERTIYAQQLYSLSILFVKDVVSSNAEGGSYMGSADIFDRDPIEVLFDKNGYIGCDNRFGAIITPFGYVVVDTIRKNIFLVKTNEPKKLTDDNVEQWFRDNLLENQTNPYAQTGISLLYDDVIKSLFLTQQATKSFTIHYNFKHQGWLSFHDYVGEQYISDRNTNYVLKTNKIYKRNHTSKCIFFDVLFSSQLVYMCNIEYETYKQVLGVMWNTLIRKDNSLLYDITIDKLVVFNDTQCSNVVDINKNINWFDTNSGVYKRDVWFLNDLKDMVLNDLEPFMDADYNIIGSNIKPAKNNWFELSQFIAKYVAIKFVYDNKFVDTTTKEVRTTYAAGYSQLSFILNDYDVNIIKALR